MEAIKSNPVQFADTASAPIALPVAAETSRVDDIMQRIHHVRTGNDLLQRTDNALLNDLINKVRYEEQISQNQHSINASLAQEYSQFSGAEAEPLPKLIPYQIDGATSEEKINKTTKKILDLQKENRLLAILNRDLQNKLAEARAVDEMLNAKPEQPLFNPSVAKPFQEFFYARRDLFA